MSRVSMIALGAGAALALGMSIAQATDFNATGEIRRGRTGDMLTLDSYNRDGFSQAGGEIFHDEFGKDEWSWHANVSTLADIGGVRAHSFASLFRPSNGSIFFASVYGGGGFATAHFTDAFIPGTPGTTIPGRVRLHVVGSMASGTSAATDGRELRVNNAVTLSIGAASLPADGGLIATSVVNGTPQPINETGMLVGFDGDEHLATRVMNLPVGEPFDIRLVLGVVTNLIFDFEEPTFTMQGNIDYHHTVTFATEGPAFELPEGFTIDVPSAGIKDNIYVGGGPTCVADFNGDGTVNSTDVSDFINAWFTDQAKGTLVTDWDGNGVVNSTDVSAFINSWFEDQVAGCG